GTPGALLDGCGGRDTNVWPGLVWGRWSLGRLWSGVVRRGVRRGLKGGPLGLRRHRLFRDGRLCPKRPVPLRGREKGCRCQELRESLGPDPLPSALVEDERASMDAAGAYGIAERARIRQVLLAALFVDEAVSHSVLAAGIVLS